MKHATSLLLGLLVAACTGCGSSSSNGSDGGTANTDGGSASADAGTTGCQIGDVSCVDVGHQRECQDVGGVSTWVNSACAEHNYCTQDSCVSACLDECALGDTRNSGGSAQTCAVYSSDSNSFVNPGSGGHNLARRHLAWTREHQLANGYIANRVFSDTSYTSALEYLGTVDAAEWTGTYLAAESFRLMTTSSPDAERNVRAIIERIHQLFDVTGTPGYMARIWAPLDGDPHLTALYDSADWSHFTTTYQGGPAFYHAWTSRDMYAGVSLGVGLAYDATSSSAHRAMLREVTVDLAHELIRMRTAVPVRVRYHLLGSWQETDLNFDMQHVVLIPNEMIDGRVFIQIGSDAEPSNYDKSELIGAREFLGDFQPVLSQIPGLGPLLPAIPRPSSAMMLANFMELALHMTKNVSGSETDHAAFQAHYDVHKPRWLEIMKEYAYHNQEECWKQYFGMTIAYHPIYSLLRLTQDASYKAAIAQDVLATRMRPFVEGHHNAYFDYIAASVGPAGLVPPGELAATGDKLIGFVAPPKTSRPVDNTGAYPANPECPNQSSTPVDVADRVPQDFLWQHHPFRLTNEFVNDRHVYPSADYLLAYWMGRESGNISDDAPNTCTRWRTN